MKRSRASQALARSEMTQTELADEIAVSHASVSHWVNGVKRPSRERRTQIADLSSAWDTGRIEPEWWDEAPISIPPPENHEQRASSKPTTALAWRDPSFLDKRIAALAEELLNEGNAFRQLRTLVQLTRMVKDVAQLRAASYDAITDFPSWRTFTAAVSNALAPFPDAASAARAALAPFEEERR